MRTAPANRRLSRSSLAGGTLCLLVACGGGGGSAPPVQPTPEPVNRATGRWLTGPGLPAYLNPDLVAPSTNGGGFLLRPKAEVSGLGALVLRSAEAWRGSAIGDHVWDVHAELGVYHCLSGVGQEFVWHRLPEDPSAPVGASTRLQFGAVLPSPAVVERGGRRFLVAPGGAVAALENGFDVAWCRRWPGADWAFGRGASARWLSAQQVTPGTMQVAAIDAATGQVAAAQVDWPEPASFAWASESPDGVMVGNFVQMPLRVALLEPSLAAQSAWRIQRTNGTFGLDYARPLGASRMVGTVHIRPQLQGHEAAIVAFAGDGSVAWAHGFQVEVPIGDWRFYDVLPFGNGMARIVCRSSPPLTTDQVTVAIAVVRGDGTVAGAIAVARVLDLELEPLQRGGYLARCERGSLLLDDELRVLRSWARADVREQGGFLWFTSLRERGVSAGDRFGRLDAQGDVDWAVRIGDIAVDTQLAYIGQSDGSAVLAWSDTFGNFVTATVRTDGSSAATCVLAAATVEFDVLLGDNPTVVRDQDVLLSPDVAMSATIGSPVAEVEVVMLPDAAPGPTGQVLPVCGN